MQAPIEQRLCNLQEKLRIVGGGELRANALRVRPVRFFHTERADHVELG